MGRLCLQLTSYQEKKYIKPIRDKIGYLFFVLNIAKIFLLPPFKKDNSGAKIIYLNSNSMRRLFVFEEDKYTSVHFPFKIVKKEETLIISCPDLDLIIDSQIISQCLEMLEEIKKTFSLLDVYLDVDMPDNTIQLFDWLISFETGYVRFDVDKKNENGHLHPINHLDINYTNLATYKLGVGVRLTEEQFIAVLNRETHCYYLSQH